MSCIGPPRGRWRRRALTAVVVASVVPASLSLVGCGSGSDEAGGPEAGGITRVELGSCGVEGPGHPERCGTFEVPIDWADPDGEQMDLRVLVVPAASGEPAPDPVFSLAGFGGSAFLDPQWTYRNFKLLEQDHDLVFVEQRGTGTMAETCDLPPESISDDTVIRDAVEACIASLQRDPRHDTTSNAVQDLDRAREALGYDRINLYGISYGTSMGLAYLQAHPERVRSAVFESGSLLDTRLWQLVPTNAQQAFDEVAGRCDADPACGTAFDPAADLETLVDRVSAEPVEVDLGGGTTLTVDAVTLLDRIIDDYLATPETAVLLPVDLAAMARGEWASVLARRGVDPSDVPVGAPTLQPEQAQTITLRCSDEWAQIDPAAVSAQADSLFVATTVARANWQRALCSSWPHDEGVGGRVETDVPVLFLNGTADPADPPANVAAAADRMPHAELVAIPGGAHGVLDNTCLVVLAQDFIADAAPAESAEWQECLDTIGSRDWVFPTS